MFKKNNRLSRAEFSEYFKKGKRYQSPHLTIITAPSDRNKVSVVVGKRVSKLAVRRNILRRRVCSQLQKTLLENKNNNYIVIVIVKPSYNTLARKLANEVVSNTFIEATT